MKAILFLSVVFLLSSTAVANDAEQLSEDKENIRKELEELTCAEFKRDLPQLAENLDTLRFVKQDSVDFEIATYVLKKVVDKSRSCIPG